MYQVLKPTCTSPIFVLAGISQCNVVIGYFPIVFRAVRTSAELLLRRRLLPVKSYKSCRTEHLPRVHLIITPSARQRAGRKWGCVVSLVDDEREEINVFTRTSLPSIIHFGLCESESRKHSLILLASRRESLHWLPFPAPRKWLMHLVYIITNVLFALQLNCDCYVQSMGKGHGIAPASALMEKSMRIHFNHCGCGRMSTTLRDRQWPGNYCCLYRFLL